MRISSNCFSNCLQISSIKRFFSSSYALYGRVAAPGRRLLAWAGERLCFVKRIFSCLPCLKSVPPQIGPQSSEPVFNSEGFKDQEEQLGASIAIRDALMADQCHGLKEKDHPFPEMSPAFRKGMEDSAIRKVQQLHPNKQDPLTVVGIGSEISDENFLLLCQLANAGYEHIAYIGIGMNAEIDTLKDYCEQNSEIAAKVSLRQILSLASYQECVLEDPTLKPDLLLCIGLGDSALNLGKKSFPEHVFSFLSYKNFLKPETVIAHAVIEEDPKNSNTFSCKGGCSQYEPGTNDLHALQNTHPFSGSFTKCY